MAVSVYSDDHGATWKPGEPTEGSADENKVVELSDGRLLLNSRTQAPPASASKRSPTMAGRPGVPSATTGT